MIPKSIKVMLVGGYPPPYGGVTIHIQRLHQYLIENGVESTVVNQHGDKTPDPELAHGIIHLTGNRLGKFLQLQRILANTNADIIHFHGSVLDNFLIGGISLINRIRKSKKVLTIHSGKFIPAYFAGSSAYRILIKRFLRRFDLLIAVNEDLKNFFIDEVKLNSESIKLIPTFIAPRLDSNFPKNRDIEEKLRYLHSVTDFVILLCGYGFNYYGYDIAMDALDNLQEKTGEKIGVILVIYTKFDPEYKANLINRIQQTYHSLIFENLEPDNFLTILRRVDCYVRPTLADSYGVTVAEALSLGIPVIASDVCPRTTGAILTKTGNVRDLIEKIIYIMNNYAQVREKVRQTPPVDYASVILDMYRNLLYKGTKE